MYFNCLNYLNFYYYDLTWLLTWHNCFVQLELELELINSDVDMLTTKTS